MNIQYISDNSGQTTGVFILIQDWEALTRRYPEVADKSDLLQWQMDSKPDDF